MELTTAEEAHLLSYFPTVEAALAFSEEIHAYLPPIQNRPEIFGPQQVLNEDDEQVGSEDLLLLNALSLSLDELVKRINERGGAAVPAHINRGNNGLLNVLGFFAAGIGDRRRGGHAGNALPRGCEQFARFALQRRALSGKHA